MINSFDLGQLVSAINPSIRFRNFKAIPKDHMACFLWEVEFEKIYDIHLFSLQVQSYLVVDVCENKLYLNAISFNKESGPAGVMQAQDDVHCIILKCKRPDTNVSKDQYPEKRKYIYFFCKKKEKKK